MIVHILQVSAIVILITILVLLALIFVFMLTPFKYELKIAYEDKRLDLSFYYIIFTFSFVMSLKGSFRYKATILNRVIADSDNPKDREDVEEVDEENGGSIEATDFIQGENLEEEIENDDKKIRDLFLKAKRRQEEKKKELNEIKEEEKEIEDTKYDDEKTAFNIIDWFDKLLPKKLIIVAKLMVREALRVLKYIKPKKVELDIDAGFDDPYTTGMMLAFAAPLYATMGSDLRMNPYFDEKKFKAVLTASRRPQFLFILIPVAELFFNKRFRDIFFKGKKTEEKARVTR